MIYTTGFFGNICSIMVNFANFMKFPVIIFLAVLLAGCGPGMNKIMKSKDPAYKLGMAEKFYAAEKYNKAYTVFEDVMPFYKTTPQYQDIYYKFAYSSYNQDDYLNSENLFKTFVETFPNSPRAEEMEYMRAYALYKQSPKAELDQTNTYKSIGMFQTFINSHPGSVRIAEAARLIEEMRKKLEKKELGSAQLYYDMGQFRAAGVTFTSVLDNFPESTQADQYKFMVVKSYYRFAELSVAEKKTERFEQVLTECRDFIDRFPESKLRKDVENYIALSNTEIQKFSSHEQIKTST